MFIKLFWFYHHAQVKSPLETEARPSPVRSCLTTRHNRRGGKKEREKDRRNFLSGASPFSSECICFFLFLILFRSSLPRAPPKDLTHPSKPNMLEKRTIGKFLYTAKSWKQSLAHYLEKFNRPHTQARKIWNGTRKYALLLCHTFPPPLSRFSFPYIIVVHDVFRIYLGVVKYDDHVAVLGVVARVKESSTRVVRINKWRPSQPCFPLSRTAAHSQRVNDAANSR